jgi:phage terminase large subunit GpA-like protein
MRAPEKVQRLSADRRDWINYRVKCPRCGDTIGPRNALREYWDIPPDPPYAALARCPRNGHVVLVEFA